MIDDAKIRADSIREAMRKAWLLGQIYHSQADSDRQSEWKHADETMSRFSALVDETVANITTPTLGTEHLANQGRHHDKITTFGP